MMAPAEVAGNPALAPGPWRPTPYLAGHADSAHQSVERRKRARRRHLSKFPFVALPGDHLTNGALSRHTGLWLPYRTTTLCWALSSGSAMAWPTPACRVPWPPTSARMRYSPG